MGHFGAYHLPCPVHPDINNDIAFFAEIVIGTVQTLGATASEVIACSIAFAAISVILSDASKPIGFALVAGLTCNSL